MRIAFLNSCLEPSRDGVGDYTRSLAQECVRRGHECCLVALNDRHVSAATTLGDGLDELRLPAASPWSQRIEQAQRSLDNFAPDWVSLQFVPYAFHPKGFVHGLGRRLRPLVAGRRVHIMFHELWQGEAVGSLYKDRIIGTAQKLLIKAMVTTLRPSIIHTSNCGYLRVLERSGIRALRLPMFGSIPIIDNASQGWLLAQMKDAGIEITEESRNQYWLFGLFGALHMDWLPEQLFAGLQAAAVTHKRHVVITSVGSLNGGEGYWNELARRYSPPFTFLRLGPQPADKVSRFFGGLDFGIATSPYKIIGKSSSVAAMVDHGLPVIVNRDDIRMRGDKNDCQDNDPLLHRMDKQRYASFPEGFAHRPPQSQTPRIAQQMLHDLSASSR